MASLKNNRDVIIYTRLSSEDGIDDMSCSITNQIDLLTEYAIQNEFRIIDIISDDGYSGTNFRRPGFEKMIEILEDGQANVVLVKDLSRFGRNFIECSKYLDEYFNEMNIRFISTSDNYDSAINTEDESLVIKNFLNGLYAKQSGKRVMDAYRHKAKKQTIAKFGRYGYKKVDGKLVIDEEVAPIVKRIFEYGAQGISPMQIAYILTNESIPTPSIVVGNQHSRKNEFKRKDWHANVIRKMLENEVYIGNLVLGKHKKINYKSRKVIEVKKEEWIVNKNTHEAIIPKEIFKQAQLQLEKRKLTRTNEYKPLLKGLITCKECGKKLGIMPYTNKGGKKTLYFRCNTYASSPLSRYCTPHNNNIEKLTEVVLEQIKTTCQKYMNEKKLKKVAKENMKESTPEVDKQIKIQTLKTEIRGIENKIDRIYEDKLNEIISEKDFARLYDNYTEKRKEIEIKIKEAEKEEAEDYTKIDVDKIVKEFISMEEITPEMIVRLVSKIELSQDKEIFIHYRFKELEK